MARDVMPPPAQPQPVNRNGRSSLGLQESIAGPSSLRGASPMTGISFANGGGFSFDKQGGMGRSVRMSSGGAGSYGARFYGGGFDSPSHPFSTSITMDGSSFNTSSAAFNLPPPLSTSASFRGGRSYAAAAKGERDHPLARGHHPNHGNLSTSFASMSFQPMSFSFGAGSYSKSQVHSLMASATSANRARTDAELTRTYECCGNTHHGLHDLLEHVEDAHPFVDAESGIAIGNERPTHIGFSPQVMAMEMDMDVAEPSNLGTIEEKGSGAGSPRSSMSPKVTPAVPTYPVPTSSSSSKASTPNEGAPSPAALQISDVLTSPFASYLVSSPKPKPSSVPSNASTSSSPPEASLDTPTTSKQPSPVFTVPKVGPTRGFLGSVSRLPQQRFDRAFNEVVAGSPKSQDAQLPGTPKTAKSTAPTAVAPGVLFASAVAGLGIPTTPPVPGQKAEPAGETTAVPAPDAELPQPSLFNSHKPWRCPNPGCTKSYKQSNGLKYHQQKGQCDFAINDALEHGLTLEEAEEKSRPFVCAVGSGCLKRYRQMNGLKYHYLNSAEHGQYGLRMLAAGTHPMPTSSASAASSTAQAASSTPSAASKTTPTIPSPNPSLNAIRRPITTSSASTATGTASAAAASTASRPYHIPSQIGATRPRMGVFPTTTPRGPIPGSGAAGLAGVGRAGVPVRPGVHSAGGAGGQGLMAGQKPAPAQLPPIQRGRDAVLFATVESMDL